MDVGSGNTYPASSLSNFAPHGFIFEGVECASMEGFLQGLKFSNPDMQSHVCTLVGRAAKSKGSKKNWKRDQTLYWKGLPIKRDSEEYQKLLTNAFNALATNNGFQRALLASQNATLTHSMGRNKINETVLTEKEFCSQLHRLRNILKEQK